MSKNNKNKDLAVKILELVGGKENILTVAHCMTRLRLTLKDTSKANIKTIKEIDDVMECLNQDGQIQVVLGPGKVTKVCNEFEQLVDLKKVEVDNGESLKQSISKKNQTPFKTLLKRISNIFIPLIPGFIGCGLLLALNNALLKFAPGWDGSQIAKVISLMASGTTGVMSYIVAYNASKEFGGSPILGSALAFIVNAPALADISLKLGENTLTFVPGRGGVISILVICAFASWLEKQIRKIIPDMLDMVVNPIIVIVVSTIMALLVIQPFGGMISDTIGKMAVVGIEQGGPIVGFILGGLFLPLVMTGVHHGLTPIHAQLIETTGMTVLLPILAMAGAGQVGASLAVYVKSKNKRIKKTIASSLVPGIFGVGEPLIYGVTLPLVKPFIGACIGGGVGGAIMALFKVGAIGMGVSGLLLAPLTNNIAMYIVAVIGAYIGGFIATSIIGFDDPEE